jgi:hypothetical protein
MLLRKYELPEYKKKIIEKGGSIFRCFRLYISSIPAPMHQSTLQEEVILVFNASPVNGNKWHYNHITKGMPKGFSVFSNRQDFLSNWKGNIENKIEMSA